MNVESESINYPSTEGAVPLVADATDVEMVAVSDSSSSKIMRNVQTQHGDYRTVDEENTFLIARCLWPDDDDKEQSTLLATASSDNIAGASGSGNASGSSSSGCVDQPAKEETEQVVWIEPFANEVCLQLFCSQNYCPLKITEEKK